MRTPITLVVLIVSMMQSMVSYGATNQEKNTSAPSPFTVEVQGKGQPILYLPGFGTPGSVWNNTVEQLDNVHTAHLITYAGFNGNAPIETPWYATVKNALIDYVNTNKLTDLIIVGHSMGGNLAVDIAAELPSYVTKIVIVDALPCMREVMMPNVPAENIVHDSPYNKRMLAMDSNQFTFMINQMATNMTESTENAALISSWFAAADRTTWVYGYTDLLQLDLREKLAQITAQTLVLAAPVPNQQSATAIYESQYQKMSNKTIVFAPKSKHFIMFDQPEWFYKTVNHFLNNEQK